MDSKLIVILVAGLFFCIANRGNADASLCRASDLVVNTNAEAGPGGRPQHFVSVINTCNCAQENIKLACPGFDYTINVFPASAIRRDGDGANCTLLGGRPVGSAQSVSFIYESSTNFSFQPVSSTTVCQIDL